MVGIPGKSKGCNTCRRRKKGCDLQRPVCGQCRKLNLHCAGYERDTIWVNLTTDTGLVRRPKRLVPPTVALPDAFARSAYHEKYLGLFWQSYLPAGKAFSADSSKYVSGLWMNEIHSMARQDHQSPVRRILLAISLTSIGRRDNTPWMIENGIQLYGSSLATLAQQLKDPVALADNNNYVASRLLSLYEILHGHDHQNRISQVKKWNLHLTGERGFLESRGPESFMTGFAHQLFVDGRSTQIALSFGTGKGSFLNEPEWKTIPWLYIPKTPKDLLGDIFAELTDVFADLDALRSTEDPVLFVILRDALVLRCQELEWEWVDWGRLYTPETSPTVSETALATDIFVDHFSAATVMAAYWSTGVLVLGTLHIALGTQDLASLDEDTDPRMCCRKLAEIIPTFVNENAGGFGIHATVAASIMALLYLEEVDGAVVSPEARAIYAAFSKSEKGRTMQHFVDNFRKRFSAMGIRLFAPLLV